MKKLFVMGLVLGLSVLANAQELEAVSSEELRGYDTHQCYSYTTIDGARGGWGYACTSYPTRIQVPDFRSTAQVIRSANDKIRDLTARVEALEKKLLAAESAR